MWFGYEEAEDERQCKLKNDWSCTTNMPICLHVMYRDDAMSHFIQHQSQYVHLVPLPCKFPAIFAPPVSTTKVMTWCTSEVEKATTFVYVTMYRFVTNCSKMNSVDKEHYLVQ